MVAKVRFTECVSENARKEGMLYQKSGAIAPNDAVMRGLLQQMASLHIQLATTPPGTDEYVEIKALLHELPLACRQQFAIYCEQQHRALTLVTDPHQLQALIEDELSSAELRQQGLADEIANTKQMLEQCQRELRQFTDLQYTKVLQGAQQYLNGLRIKYDRLNQQWHQHVEPIAVAKAVMAALMDPAHFDDEDHVYRRYHLGLIPLIALRHSEEQQRLQAFLEKKNEVGAALFAKAVKSQHRQRLFSAGTPSWPVPSQLDTDVTTASQATRATQLWQALVAKQPVPHLGNYQDILRQKQRQAARLLDLVYAALPELVTGGSTKKMRQRGDEILALTDELKANFISVTEGLLLLRQEAAGAGCHHAQIRGKAAVSQAKTLNQWFCGLFAKPASAQLPTASVKSVTRSILKSTC